MAAVSDLVVKLRLDTSRASLAIARLGAAYSALEGADSSRMLEFVIDLAESNLERAEAAELALETERSTHRVAEGMLRDRAKAAEQRALNAENDLREEERAHYVAEGSNLMENYRLRAAVDRLTEERDHARFIAERLAIELETERSTNTAAERALRNMVARRGDEVGREFHRAEAAEKNRDEWRAYGMRRLQDKLDLERRNGWLKLELAGARQAAKTARRALEHACYDLGRAAGKHLGTVLLRRSVALYLADAAQDELAPAPGPACDPASKRTRLFAESRFNGES
jgi:hypothetical protein